jgi:hypothetical protein
MPSTRHCSRLPTPCQPTESTSGSTLCAKRCDLRREHPLHAGVRGRACIGIDPLLRQPRELRLQPAYIPGGARRGRGRREGERAIPSSGYEPQEKGRYRHRNLLWRICCAFPLPSRISLTRAQGGEPHPPGGEQITNFSAPGPFRPGPFPPRALSALGPGSRD